MNLLSIGGTEYRLIAVEQNGAWVAHAERTADGERFGIESAAATEEQSIERLAAWLAWQHEHSAALASLQEAERRYQRAITGSAFASPDEGPDALEIQKESLDEVEAARNRLDEVRARRPE